MQLNITTCTGSEALSNSHIVDTPQGLQFNFQVYHKDCFFDLKEQNYVVQILIHPAYFEKYQEPYDYVTQKQTICCSTQTKLFDIIHCEQKGILRKIFLEGSILQLLFLTQKNPLLLELNCNTCAIANQPLERDKLEQAKSYILQHLSENITIPLIASVVGTNQCYLKKGFKEYTGKTIFEFIQELRMNKAKHYLEQGEMTITEVAAEIGYNSVSSFSQAFKNYFGTNPSAFTKISFPVRPILN